MGMIGRRGTVKIEHGTRVGVCGSAGGLHSGQRGVKNVTGSQCMVEGGGGYLGTLLSWQCF